MDDDNPISSGQPSLSQLILAPGSPDPVPETQLTQTGQAVQTIENCHSGKAFEPNNPNQIMLVEGTPDNFHDNDHDWSSLRDDENQNFIKYGNFQSQQFLVPETQLSPSQGDNLIQSVSELQAYEAGTSYSQSSNFQSHFNSLPLNHTLNSVGQKVVILIKPKGTDGVEMIRNPVKFDKAFSTSKFGRYRDNTGFKLRTNWKLGLTVVEMEKITKPEMTELLEVNKIGDWQVTCSLPNSDRYKYGVISQISPEASIDDLKSMICSLDNDTEIGV